MEIVKEPKKDPVKFVTDGEIGEIKVERKVSAPPIDDILSRAKAVVAQTQKTKHKVLYCTACINEGQTMAHAKRCGYTRDPNYRDKCAETEE